MKFSPTTFIGYVRCFAALAICGKPFYLYMTDPKYNVVAAVAGASALNLLINGAVSAVAGHFTADAPNPPKP